MWRPRVPARELERAVTDAIRTIFDDRASMIAALQESGIEISDVDRIVAIASDFEEGLSGKTVGNIMGLLHKAFADAIDEGLLEKNPVLRTSSRRVRRSRRERVSPNPLTSAEVAQFLECVPAWYRDSYTVWFYLGWRSSEIVALRFGWVDFERQYIKSQRGRIPRMGGLEAEPKPDAVSRLLLRTRDLRGAGALAGASNFNYPGGLRFYQSKPQTARSRMAERAEFELLGDFINGQ